MLNPPGEPSRSAIAALAPVDDYLARRRVPIIVGTLAVVALASPSLLWLSFDFNPIYLQNPKSEAIATYLELRRDPASGVDAIQVLAPSLDQANAAAAKFEKLPEVAGVRTLSTFIPADQDAKLPIIRSRRDQARRRLRRQRRRAAADRRRERRGAERRRAAPDRGRRRATAAPAPQRCGASPPR